MVSVGDGVVGIRRKSVALTVIIARLHYSNGKIQNKEVEINTFILWKIGKGKPSGTLTVDPGADSHPRRTRSMIAALTEGVRQCVGQRVRIEEVNHSCSDSGRRRLEFTVIGSHSTDDAAVMAGVFYS